MALTALLAACLDSRITAIDCDFVGCCYEKAGPWEDSSKGLPTVSSILCRGDLWQWTALLADRHVTLRNVPPSNADRTWLEGVFKTIGGQNNLIFID